jgi:hypothetical protein
MLTAMGEVVRRGETGEGPKVVDEMRLIEVTAPQSQLRPFHAHIAPDESYAACCDEDGLHGIMDR